MLLNYKYIELCFEITETDLLQKNAIKVVSVTLRKNNFRNIPKLKFK